MRKTLSAHAVKTVRQSSGLIRRALESGTQVVVGFLTISQLADHLQVHKRWFYSMMRSGKLMIEKDGFTGAYLFPDTPETLKKLAALKAGKIENLSFLGASR